MKQTTDAMMPRNIEPTGPAKPDAGVTATRPAMTPDTRPRSDGLPLVIHSAKSQPAPAPAAARKVFITASEVIALASRLEPALKPNQPTKRSAAPIMVMVSEWGAMLSLP